MSSIIHMNESRVAIVSGGRPFTYADLDRASARGSEREDTEALTVADGAA